MTSVVEVVNWAKGLADSGQGADIDGMWGTQCVDIVNWVTTKYFGKALWGNAIDLMASAESHKFECHYMPTAANPRTGAVFVMSVPDHGFGHTGLVIEDSDGYSMRTIEQNIDGYSDVNGDGINDQLQFGGPARYNTRDFTGVIGWFYPPYDTAQPVIDEPLMTSNPQKLKDEKGTFTVEVAALNVRNQPSLSGDIQAVYGKNMTVNYDSVYQSDGYIWISYVSYTGERRYLACGKEKNGRNIAPFGSFK
ncbi:SH3 domain-containing protein [Streptococcus sp. sy004]|uniref:SH3 domain-containing protein n=1 Tax=Streptococcus sp. sy004 TaxID=2600149 RepID=UPI0011B428AB|nr:SH3 domain-containing protein [Streptococcus sp. sy004]TWT12087.1 CHAP domain-containing protein [Streptococcus sp. sy004]